MTAKLIFCLVLILNGGLFNSPMTARCADESRALRVKIDIPENAAGGKPGALRALENRDPQNRRFFVVLENASSNRVFLPMINGIVQGLSFEITADDDKQLVIHRIEPDRSKTVFGRLVIEPGEISVLEIDYARTQEWQFPFPEKPGETRKVTIRAVYEQHPPDGPGKAVGRAAEELWAGRAVSPSYEVALFNNYEKPSPPPAYPAGIGFGVDTGKAYGMLSVNLATDGSSSDPYLKSLTITSGGNEWSIPQKALAGIERPIVTTAKFEVKPFDTPHALFDVRLDLGKPASLADTGDWKVHRVHFIFQDGKFIKRYTTMEIEQTVEEWKPESE